jgi:hypothetical protein
MRDGIPLRTTAGKIIQTELIEFADREIRDRWADSVIAALRQAYHDFDSDDSQGDNYNE